MKNIPYTHRLAVGLLVGVITQLVSPAMASDWIGAWPGYPRGNAANVTVASNLAYVSLYSYGVAIFDVRDPARPARLGGFSSGGEARDVQVVGHLAYAADYSTGVKVLDLTRPPAPAVIGEIVTAGYTSHVRVSGRYAYLADSGLQVLDVSNPARPARVGGTETPEPVTDMDLAGKFAYLDEKTMPTVRWTTSKKPGTTRQICWPNFASAWQGASCVSNLPACPDAPMPSNRPRI